MADTTTFTVFLRIGSDGTTAAVTDLELEQGTSLADVWLPDDGVTHRDVVIEVTAAVPLALEGRAADVSVMVPDEAPAALHAAPSAT